MAKRISETRARLYLDGEPSGPRWQWVAHLSFQGGPYHTVVIGQGYVNRDDAREAAHRTLQRLGVKLSAIFPQD